MINAWSASILFSADAGETFNGQWLADRNDNTCNMEESRNVSVTLELPIVLSWIRLVVKPLEAAKIPRQKQRCASPGQFGDQCQHTCHCANVLDCDSFNGFCSSGCAIGWFGPACQYALYRELQIKYTTSDGKEGTCAGGPNAKVDDRTLDIVCVTDSIVKKLHLVGPGVESLCSLYINGVWRARNAVDGLIPHNSTNMAWQCSKTKFTDGRRWNSWDVQLPAPTKIIVIYIYNLGNPKSGYHTSELTVRFRNKDINLDNFVYGAGRGTWKNVHVTIQGGQQAEKPVLEVAISAKSLGLCEVKVFGESVCEKGKWGWYCDRTCNCAGEEPCLAHSGGCPSGCASGFAGADCRTKTVRSPSRLSEVDELVPGKPLVVKCNPGLVESVNVMLPIQGLTISRRRPGDAVHDIIVDYTPYHPLGVNKFVNVRQRKSAHATFFITFKPRRGAVSTSWVYQRVLQRPELIRIELSVRANIMAPSRKTPKPSSETREILPQF
ncbi:fucolectin-related molecule [Elysia marginata]|uniref:Fucolectin-related molecule n=1 Tax=Elysia marginata TaxID=1093978 RepID=A0AAV4J3D3_9GAST|nr:fucolectin-related molecule [Elysia marginata]